MMKKQLHGFTIIELTLSLVFIATLSLIVVLIIMNTVASYQRGLVLKQINTVGMDVVDDMRSVIQNSSTKSLVGECTSIYEDSDSKAECEANGGKVFVSFAKYADVQITEGQTASDIPVYGAFCTGMYSYVWNSGYFFAADENEYPKIASAHKLSLVYSNDDADVRFSDFRLLKVRDTSRSICIAANVDGTEVVNGMDEINMKKYGVVLDSQTADLLESTNFGLALYDLSASAPATSDIANGLFYSVSFILGTVQGGIDVTASGSYCAPPGDYGQSLNYCAINKFNFAAMAAGD